ncbi:hypothetical protein [Leptolyngbya sp. FACHB-17]|uniref:hypothetical protein n=1 Tax=unclassified Leptolyngbya TaxID=2650499 RepID=UPI001681021E|nr:hypothetical protein [Leptolyngbya sp. FACHB-17]MBD2082328.1 hypothetical protein [Leptolyngbya sp. FACHB-17]
MNAQVLVALFISLVGVITVSQHTENSNNLTSQFNVAQEVQPFVDHRGSGRIYTDAVTNEL